jgi:hypothetical protein
MVCPDPENVRRLRGIAEVSGNPPLEPPPNADGVEGPAKPEQLCDLHFLPFKNETYRQKEVGQ